MLLGSKNLLKFVKNKKCMKVYNSQRFFFFLSKKVCNFWWEFTLCSCCAYHTQGVSM